MKKVNKKQKKELSDIRLLQIAEIQSLCKWGGEKLKDIHYKINTLLDEGSDEEIEEYMAKCQEFFLMLKSVGSDSEWWIHGSTSPVLEFYKKEKPSQFNKLDVLFKKEGSKLQNHIYIKKK